MANFKPMLAPQEDPLSHPDFFEELIFPVYGSPKIDGIRCIVKDSQCMSRSFKPLPSLQAQESFNVFEHADGELIEGNITDFGVYNRTQSHIMSRDKPGELSYHVFDFTHPDWLDVPFFKRYEALLEVYNDSWKRLAEERGVNLHIVKQTEITSLRDLLYFEEYILGQGYEGVMGKFVLGEYKCGRGTWKQQLIWKLKRFKDDEGLVVGFRPRLHNLNEAKIDALGYTERSSHRDNKVALEMVGMFEVLWEGQVLDVAPGNFNHDQLSAIWKDREKYLGKVITFRYMSHGVKDKPRHPRAKGFRDKLDL